MSTCLINLENYSYQDYLDITQFINETMTENKEVNRLLDTFKKVVNDLDNDIDTFDREKVEKLLDELNKNAESINAHNKNIYKTISTISDLIKFVETIISICKFIKGVKDFFVDKKVKYDNACKAFENLSPDEQRKLKKDKKAFDKWFKDAMKDDKTFFDKLKGGIKDFFSIKSLITKALSTINKIIGVKAKSYLSYEKDVDKAYELLLNCEAKMMIEKRKAKQEHDTVTEENCDTVIEFIENLKKERIKAKELARRSQNESTLLESEKSEFKINNFKLVCRDISEALNIEKENIKAYCDASIYVVKRALEINESNKDKKIDLMEAKVKEVESFTSNIDRVYDKQTIDTLLKKYGNVFSVKYTSFGMKAKEEFEKRLAEIGKEMNDYVELYHKELSTLVTGNDNSNMRSILTELESKVTKKVNQSTYNGIRRIISELDDKSGSTFDFCRVYIDWCRNTLDISNIKHSLKYKITSKLFR